MRLALRSWKLLAVLAIGAAARAAIAQDDVPSRIAGAALTDGGASAFLQTLTDTVGGRVTGSKESLMASELILRTLKAAGYENARFEEFPLESRWTRGPASGRIVSPISRTIVVGSYAWVPGTAGAITAPLVDLGTPPSNEWTPPAERVRGAAVLIDPQKVGTDPSFVMRSIMAESSPPRARPRCSSPRTSRRGWSTRRPSASIRRGRCR